MSEFVSFKIDGKQCMGRAGEYITEAAERNNIYIPTLCDYKGTAPKASCRVCTVKVNGRVMTSCTTPLQEGMEIENETAEIQDIRSGIIELLFAEGNHLCPSCEKSGSCELQALGYRFRMMVPRFPYLFPVREIDASHPKLIKDHNRCILCKRCVRVMKDEKGRSFFAFYKRGAKLEITIAPELADKITDEVAQQAMDVCPTGALLKKRKGWDVPVGKRLFDMKPIGSEFEQVK